MLLARATAAFATLCPALIAAERGAFLASADFENVSMGRYPNTTFYSSKVTVPIMNLNKWDPSCDSDDFIFLTPSVKGVKTSLIIADQRGHLIWGSNESPSHRNLHVVKYKGNSFLAYFENHHDDLFAGYCMLNHMYEEVFRITPTRPMNADRHSFTITPDDTALFTIYEKKQSENGSWFSDAVFQEVAVETGQLLYEWRATDHFSFSDMSIVDSRGDGTEDLPYDIYHINSAVKDRKGNYLISMRYNNAITYLDSTSGDIIWQLGGKNNSFSVPSDADPSTLDWMANHDARWTEKENEISLFDNHGWNYEERGPSRGVKIQIDTSAMTARLVGEYIHPAGIFAESQGSHQILPNGHSLIGWGKISAFSEYAANGTLLCDVHFAPVLIDNGAFKKTSWAQSYRAYKQPWIGYPSAPPQVARRHDDLYVSWNGATEVKDWVLEGCEAPINDVSAVAHNIVTHIATITKTGFETKMSLIRDRFSTWKLTALDSKSQKLGVWEIDSEVKRVETIFQINAEAQTAQSFMNNRHEALVSRSAPPVLVLFVVGLIIVICLKFIPRNFSQFSIATQAGCDLAKIYRPVSRFWNQYCWQFRQEQQPKYSLLRSDHISREA